MDIVRAEIADVLILNPKKFEDARGHFVPVYQQSALAEAGVMHCWIQDNQSLSRRKGTVRGLHFQRPPFAQAKLVRVVRGAALDVCVDLRRAAPTFGKHVAVELTADNLKQVYIPPGFAHGFCTLTDDVEVLYRVSEQWSREHEGGLRWDDPALGIDWPVTEAAAVLVERDRNWPGLATMDQGY